MKLSQLSSKLAWAIYFAIAWAGQGAAPAGRSPAGLSGWAHLSSERQRRQIGPCPQKDCD